MIIEKVEFGDHLDRIYKDIPAYMKDGKLVIGHNGSSKNYSQSTLDLENYTEKDFEYFCDHTYRGA